MEIYNINLSKKEDVALLRGLKPRAVVKLSGNIYVMRDAGHKRYMEDLAKGVPPFYIKNAVIYYMGPCPAANGRIIGSAGPTTASRMDAYAPVLYDMGMLASIGKGERSNDVIQSIKRNNALYLSAIGGAGALYQDCIKSVMPVAYEELGAEACIIVRVDDFPCFVTYSSAY